MSYEEQARIVLEPVVTEAWRHCDMVDRVAQALRDATLTEREACAKIADAEVKGPATEIGRAMDFTARSIAAAIRNRT